MADFTYDFTTKTNHVSGISAVTIGILPGDAGVTATAIDNTSNMHQWLTIGITATQDASQTVNEPIFVYVGYSLDSGTTYPVPFTGSEITITELSGLIPTKIIYTTGDIGSATNDILIKNITVPILPYFFKVGFNNGGTYELTSTTVTLTTFSGHSTQDS